MSSPKSPRAIRQGITTKSVHERTWSFWNYVIRTTRSTRLTRTGKLFLGYCQQYADFVREALIDRKNAGILYAKDYRHFSVV
ncbi:hypothetical protein EI981_18515 [Paenibacillus lutimineralis]|uniref:Uncharacterized protein n=1 Tax=Paenibacillus lutimineralis TaxID=2707005 RepID=A0A3Q9IA67_9BACL|nr:hypothetical protein EI981_18515 [Paenibacillus lutimineralis]